MTAIPCHTYDCSSQRTRWKRKAKPSPAPPLQSYSLAPKESRVIDTNTNSLLALLHAERLHSSPRLSTCSTKHLHAEPPPSVSSSSAVRRDTSTALSAGKAHCSEAAQPHKIRKQENIPGQFPAPWSPNPSQVKGS